MAVITGATLAAGAVAASGTLSELLGYCKDARDTLRAHGTPSLTSYTKQTNIMSRLYIEDNILRDDICVPLVGVLNQLYVSYVLSALNLDTMCANGRTVREMIEVVGTESYDLVAEIMNKFGSNRYNYSNEDVVVDLEPATQRLPVGRLIELTMMGAIPSEVKETTVSGDRTTTTSTQKGTATQTGSTTSQRGDQTTTTTGGDTDTTQFDENNNITGYSSTTRHNQQQTTKYGQDSGSSSTTTTYGPDNSTTKQGSQTTVSTKQTTGTFSFKAYLYVQMIPYILHSDVIGGYVKANFNPPIASRWQKFRAGEISFWNDFVFTRDLIKNQEKILKKDKSNIITEMMTKNRGKLGRWFMGLLGIKPISHNIANSIMICNKETFKRACSEAGIKFEDYNQRQRYFNKTWSMIICVVDPMYNTVEMYFNGLDAKGTYTFDMVNKVGAKGKDSFDLKEIMGAFSQGLSPKF